MESFRDELKGSSSLLEFKRKIMEWKPHECTRRICKVVFVSNLGFLH